MRVWIDERSCVGNGICEELCPEMFTIVDGDVAKVRDGNRLLPGGPAHPATVASGMEEAVMEAANECPVGCIHVS